MYGMLSKGSADVADKIWSEGKEEDVICGANVEKSHSIVVPSSSWTT
jgi:hypothetical protein